MMMTVIIAAAGSGSRMQQREKKQFIELDGQPILLRTLKQFDLEGIDEIVLVTGEDDVPRVQTMVESCMMSCPVKVVAGGQRRQDSVLNALKAAKGDFVMIHDGARPFIHTSIIQEHLDRIETSHGLVTCVPTKDTIKVVRDGVIERTLDRSTLVNVQTPQTFHKEDLLKAYSMNPIQVTDDASLMEAAGFKIETVMGDYKNIKITTPEDLGVGLLILKGAL